MNILDYIQPELLVLSVVAYIIGLIVKNSKVDNRHIPWINLGVCVVLAGLWVVASVPLATPQEWATAIFTALVQGTLCAGLATYADQLVKQAKACAGSGTKE